MDVSRLALAPGFEHALGVVDHDLAVALDLLELEGRLGELSLPAQKSPSLVSRPMPMTGIGSRVSLSLMKFS